MAPPLCKLLAPPVNEVMFVMLLGTTVERAFTSCCCGVSLIITVYAIVFGKQDDPVCCVKAARCPLSGWAICSGVAGTVIAVLQGLAFLCLGSTGIEFKKVFCLFVLTPSCLCNCL